MQMHVNPFAREDAEYLDVRDFNLKFNQIVNADPVHLSRRKLAQRANFMLEELLEFAEASGLMLSCNADCEAVFVIDPEGEQDLELQADALIDIVYVAKGTAVMSGLPWQAFWSDVQRANMAKHQVPGKWKIAKPEGWIAPRTKELLMAAGYHVARWFHPVEVALGKWKMKLNEEMAVDDHDGVYNKE